MDNLRKAIETIVVISVFATIFFMLTGRVNDPDFWWHLKTGEWIWQNTMLPSEDPFSYTVSKIADPVRKNLILTQYWLSQVIFYMVYTAFEFQGIILLRASLLTIMFLFIYLWLRRYGIKTAPSVLFTLIPALIIIKDVRYIGDRPQLWSTLLFPVVVGLLERIRSAPIARYSYFVLPLIMLIWANMHGGFILGAIVICIYIVIEVVKKVRNLPVTHQGSYFYIICGISVAMCLVNPNTYHAITVFINLPYQYTKDIFEFQSPFYHMLYLGNYYWWYLALFSAGILTVIIKFGKFEITHLLLLSGLMIISSISMRYVVFFAAVGSVIVAVYSRNLLNKFEKPVLLVQTVFIFYLLAAGLSQGIYLQKGFKQGYYPEKAAAFIKGNNIKGNIFNYYDWGGYLLYSLSPERKVFIDGRAIQLDIYELYEKIILNKEGAKDMLEAFAVDYIIIPGCNLVNGTINPLVYNLAADNKWVLIYADELALVFVGRDRKSEVLINEYSLKKEDIWDHIAKLSYSRLSSGRWGWFFSMAVSYEKKGDREKAIFWYGEALRRITGGKNKEEIQRRIIRLRD